MAIFEYAPGARVPRDRRHPAVLRPVHQRAVRRARRTARRFKTINPATEEVLAEIVDAGRVRCGPCSDRGSAAYDSVWQPMAGKARAKYLYRIARIIQERARELAVLESIDNGKPIRESRDVDIPLVAAHFFYYAGWADKLGYAGFGCVARARSAWPARSYRGTSRC